MQSGLLFWSGHGLLDNIEGLLELITTLYFRIANGFLQSVECLVELFILRLGYIVVLRFVNRLLTGASTRLALDFEVLS
jgi:hypothetical protein